MLFQSLWIQTVRRGGMVLTSLAFVCVCVCMSVFMIKNVAIVPNELQHVDLLSKKISAATIDRMSWTFSLLVFLSNDAIALRLNQFCFIRSITNTFFYLNQSRLLPQSTIGSPYSTMNKLSRSWADFLFSIHECWLEFCNPKESILICLIYPVLNIYDNRKTKTSALWTTVVSKPKWPTALQKISGRFTSSTTK